MKTYYTPMYCQRLANCLVAYGKPFRFDGIGIEFDATTAFVEKIQNLDKVLAKIEFNVK